MAANQIELIKQKADIVSYINERVTLQKSGRNFKGLCPFHGEKSPSFFVSPEMQIYKCFGCQASGDILSFIQEYEGLSFPEALQLLADKVGVELEKVNLTSADKQHHRLQELLHHASAYYHFLLTKHQVGRKALAYLKHRAVTNQSITDFQLGYASQSWDALTTYLVKKKQYTQSEIVSAGLAIRSDSGRVYDRFRGRVMFPQHTFSGKIVGFSGRLLAENPKEAKYINTPETDLYHKSQILYGMPQAKRQIKERNRIIVVEGELDVISSHQIGLKETVAIKGSALTKEQAQLIRRLTHQVILALDNDEAGQEAIKRAIPVCEDQALDLSVAQMSQGKDPDELARNHPKLLKQAYQQTISVYDYFILQATKDITDQTSGEAIHRAFKQLAPIFASIDSAVKKEVYVKKVASKLGVSINSVNQELVKHAALAKLSSPPTVSTAPKPASRQELLEKQAIGLLLHLGQTSTSSHACQPDWFIEPHTKRLLTKLIELTSNQPTLAGAELVNQLPEAMRQLAQQIFTLTDAWFNQTITDLTDQYHQTCVQLELTFLKRRLTSLSQQMATSDEAKSKDLQQEYHRLSKTRMQLEGGRNNNPSV